MAEPKKPAKQPASKAKSVAKPEPVPELVEGPVSVDSTIELPPLDPGLIAAIVGGYHPQPHATLGQHPVDGGFVIRTVRPLAATVTAIRAD
ncbi:MAG TPA: hypothetical protein VHU90_05545, partial [Galbitalea sp.]|nr:hypothetical protein [Galbitalea sp.]